MCGGVPDLRAQRARGPPDVGHLPGDPVRFQAGGCPLLCLNRRPGGDGRIADTPREQSDRGDEDRRVPDRVDERIGGRQDGRPHSPSADEHHADKPLTTLGAEEAAEFAAIASRILPSDETPGATEGGVIYFIDTVLGSSRSELLAPLREGLASLQAVADASYGSARFSALSPDQQDALLHTVEKSDFFATVRFLTLAGMFALPEYGGNRDHIGWDLLGFDHRHVWQPPFGYYDADYMQRGE